MFGQKGFVRKRKNKTRPMGKTTGSTMDVYSVGKFSVGVERKKPMRKLAHFAG